MNDAYATLTAPDTLRIERLLPGPIERVWRYLTEPQLRRQWLADGPMELRVGGEVELQFHNDALTANDEPAPSKYAPYGGPIAMRGRVTACEPPALLAYTWGEADGEASEVRFELRERGDQVALTVVHARLRGRDMRIDVASGWHTHLALLIDRLHGREPRGFWRTLRQVEPEYASRLQD